MKELYTLNLDVNNYVLSIAHTQNDNVELDLSLYDLKHLSCYRLINDTLVLDENKLSETIAKEEQETIKQKEKEYSNKVAELIRKKYSINDELAILRQRDEKPSEYQEYFAYCEECKTKAKNELGL